MVRAGDGLEPGGLMERFGIFLSSEALRGLSKGMTWPDLHGNRITLAALN